MNLSRIIYRKHEYVGWILYPRWESINWKTAVGLKVGVSNSEKVEKIDNTVVLDSDDAQAHPVAAVSWLPETQALEQQMLGQALYRLQQWLIEMHQRRFAEDDEGIVKLNAEVSARFALGLQFKDAFIVMPELEASWASLIPWSHAAMREGNPTVYLVTQNFEIDGAPTPDFGISFQIPDLAKAQMLSTKSTLQLRRYIQHGDGWAVSPSPFAQMPLQILVDDSHPFDKKGRKLKFKGRAA